MPPHQLPNLNHDQCVLTWRAQVDGYIHFDKVEPLQQWAVQIQGACAALNGVVDAMVAAGIKVAL
jgi:hypothetical protein